MPFENHTIGFLINIFRKSLRLVQRKCLKYKYFEKFKNDGLVPYCKVFY